MVINLDKRKDRLKLFEAEFGSVFANELYTRISAEFGKPSRYFIAKSHKKAVQYAKDLDLDYVCIMEDDVKFTSVKAAEYMQGCIDRTPPPNWDILLGGAYSDTITQVDIPWLKLSDFCGLHFYIVRRKAYDTIISMPENSKLHIDKWLGTESGLNCYRTKKIFALQRSGYSDNVDRVICYDNILNVRDML